MRKSSKLKKSSDILKDSKVSEWLYVNTDNEFTLMGAIFVISKDVKEYKVYNKAGEVEDFTNESYMEKVLAVVNKNNQVKFYNQNYELIDESLIYLKEETKGSE